MGEVGPLVVGVSKAIFQRFDSWEEAHKFVAATQALKKIRTESLPTGTPDSDVWYAVTNSKTGYYAIFPSWPAAQIHVVNINGASVRKFRIYVYAQEYTYGHETAWKQKTANSPISHVPFSEYLPASVPPAKASGLHNLTLDPTTVVTMMDFLLSIRQECSWEKIPLRVRLTKYSRSTSKRVKRNCRMPSAPLTCRKQWQNL
jgi:hypothetical protein